MEEDDKAGIDEGNERKGMKKYAAGMEEKEDYVIRMEEDDRIEIEDDQIGKKRVKDEWERMKKMNG